MEQAEEELREELREETEIEEDSLHACLEALSKMIFDTRLDIIELQMNIDARRGNASL